MGRFVGRFSIFQGRGPIFVVGVGCRFQVLNRDLVVVMGSLTGKKCGGWHGYQRRDEKIHRMKLSNTVVITGLHANIFSMTNLKDTESQVTLEDSRNLTGKKCSGCVMLN